jgi:hypothetical protein
MTFRSEAFDKAFSEAFSDPTGEKAADLLARKLQERENIIMKAMLGDLYHEISAEVIRSDKHQATFASLHEAYAVILEEVDELWEIVRLKKSLRSSSEIRTELIQIAAMSVKALQSMDNFIGGSI